MSAARSSLDDALAEGVIVVEAAFGICARHRCALWQNKQPALFLCSALLSVPLRALSAIGGWNERGLPDCLCLYNVLPFVRYNVSAPASPNSHAEAGVLPA